jgi:hypothetical protein
VCVLKYQRRVWCTNAPGLTELRAGGICMSLGVKEPSGDFLAVGA